MKACYWPSVPEFPKRLLLKFSATAPSALPWFRLKSSLCTLKSSVFCTLLSKRNAPYSIEVHLFCTKHRRLFSTWKWCKKISGLPLKWARISGFRSLWQPWASSCTQLESGWVSRNPTLVLACNAKMQVPNNVRERTDLTQVQNLICFEHEHGVWSRERIISSSIAPVRF